MKRKRLMIPVIYNVAFDAIAQHDHQQQQHYENETLIQLERVETATSRRHHACMLKIHSIFY
jgi:hypothetical protein